MRILRSFDLLIDKVVTGFLIVSVLSMLGLSVSNIVLRWFNMHVMWIEPLVRYLVVIAAFLGGVIATGQRRHIAIDIVGKYLESSDRDYVRVWLLRIIDIVCVIALSFLVYACYNFVLEESSYGKIVFLGLHSKYLAAILPLGFGAMTVRFLLNFLLSFHQAEVK